MIFKLFWRMANICTNTIRHLIHPPSRDVRNFSDIFQVNFKSDFIAFIWFCKLPVYMRNNEWDGCLIERIFYNLT